MYSPSLVKTYFPTSFIKSIGHFFDNHPVKSQSLLAGALWALGDVIAQKITAPVSRQEPRPPMNYTRIFTMMAYGTIVQGPINFHWYTHLGKWIQYDKKSKEIFYKVVLDQAIMGPTQIFLFIAFVTGVEKRKVSSMKKRLNRNFLDLFLVDITIWPFIQSVNFAFVQPRFQSIVVNTVSVVYNTILTYLLHGEKTYFFHHLFGDPEQKKHFVITEPN